MIFNGFDIMYDEELMKRYSRASNIIDLAFDECQAKPKDITPMPSIPKSLRSFRWAQNFSCFDRGFCQISFYNTLGESLSHHRETLENPDLDLPHTVTHTLQTKGHGANPYVNPLDMLGLERRRSWMNDRLLGSLKDFSSLKSQEINPEVLCDNSFRGRASLSLPHSLLQPPSFIGRIGSPLPLLRDGRRGL
jgi:hypothetical protein